MDFDTRQYMEIFIQDAEENLEVMNRALLTLDSDPADAEALGEVFRTAHSMKSASAMMGFGHISTFTHAMEDVLHGLRNSEQPAPRETINRLFACADLLQEMIGCLLTPNPQREQETRHRAAEMTTLLRACPTEGANNTARSTPMPANNVHELKAPGLLLDAAQRARAEALRLAGNRLIQVDVRLACDALMPFARATLVVDHLRRHGELIATYPPLTDDIADFPTRFSLLLATTCDDNILHRAADVDSVRGIALRDVTQVEQYEVNDTVPETSTGPTEGPRTSFERREDRASTKTVRVDLEKLDHLLNLAGELAICRSRTQELATRLAASTCTRAEPHDLLEMVTAQGSLLNALQESIMALRLIPVSQLFQRFPRLVRDLAKERGREVELVLHGEETELDKKLADQLSDPLAHMVRNAIDHGIETPDERLAAGKPRKGRLMLRADHEGNHVCIVVEDDGRGLDMERIRRKCVERGVFSEQRIATVSDRELYPVIFQPGFSTAEQVTDLSGRGVGMDVVLRNLEMLGGTIDIDSRAGKGTRFFIRIPLTLAIIRALLVEVRGERYALPLAHVQEMMRIRNEDIFTIEGRSEVIRLQDSIVPLLRLDQWLGHQHQATSGERLYLAIVSHKGGQVALAVDRMVGEQEIVIKPLDGVALRPHGIAGATIRGDGNVSLILDIGSLVSSIRAAQQVEGQDGLRETFQVKEKVNAL